jgi:hypothetical protein
MGEPRRWKIHLNKVGAITDYGTVSDQPHDTVRVREDRATEAEKTKIEAWLEENYGAAVRDLIGVWGGEECWDDDAEELLALVFDGEASCV